MRWFYVTIGLLATSLCLVVWIYLRDRDTNWRLPEAQQAHVDVASMLHNALRGADCHSGCATEVLGRSGPHNWLVRITVKHRSRCLQIDLNTFRFGQHRLFGVQSSGECR